ncbi:MAG: translation initiation factor IF-2, partial [Spirochaetales bacterium]|nr:translation initiation factor IF-2 [Spirochaetales bacterium]
MSEDLEKKEPKATLIKHKKTDAAPPKKESGDSKKKVVVVKKKVVVKKAHKVVATKENKPVEKAAEAPASEGRTRSTPAAGTGAPIRRAPRNPDRVNNSSRGTG